MGHGTRVTRVTRNDKPGANLSLSLSLSPFATKCAVTPREEQGAEATTANDNRADAKRIARLRSITYDCLAPTRDTSSAPDRCGNAKTAVKSRGRQDGTRKVRKPGGSDRGIIERERGREREDKERKARGVTNKYTRRYTRGARESPSFRVSL